MAERRTRVWPRRLALVYGVLGVVSAVSWALVVEVWWLQPLHLLTFWWTLPALVLVPLALRRRAWVVAVACLPAALVWLTSYGGLFVPGGVEAGDDRFRVLSFNTFVQASGIDHVVDEVVRQDPDIVLLQEVFPRREELLHERLGTDYPFHEARQSPGVGGVMVLSRHPIVDVRDVGEPSASSRSTIVVTVEVDGRRVQVVPVHLISPCPECGNSLTARLDFEETVRRLEIAAVLRSLDPGTPTVIGGDFNSTDRSSPYRRLVRAGFDDPHRAVGFGPGFTWPNQGWLPAMLRIDALFTRGLDPVASFVGDGGASDHRPVVLDVAFRDG